MTPDAAPDAGRRRALVVDDDPVSRRMVTAVLERAGLDVVESTDGCEAWVELTDTPFDIVITDREMPEMDGLELIRTMRRSTVVAAVPIVMLTASPRDARGTEANREGASAFLTKPVSSRELVDTVRALLPSPVRG
jgi:CheY-like chemotaxis protein